MVQIQCKGRDSVPDNESVNIFVHEVRFFNIPVSFGWSVRFVVSSLRCQLS